MNNLGLMKGISILIFASLISGGCGLTGMKSKYNKVSYSVTPPVMQVHGGKIEVQIDGSFPEKYFAKKALVDFTPVLVGSNSETALKTITLQGEEATGGETTIAYQSGGNFSYSDKVDFTDDMKDANLEIRATAKMGDKTADLGPISITKGVITTSQRVQNDEDIAFADHGYEKETILTETATIYFLVNQSDIRTTEKSDKDIQKIRDFAKLDYKTHSIEIKSYASPEGKVGLNDNLSEDRGESTISYFKQMLKGLKLDGANNEDTYTKISFGEDWEGFNRLMNASEMQDKGRVLNIVNSVQDPEKRELAIRDLSELYDAIEKNILPQLRKSDITIRSYEPKRTDEEITSLATTNPEMLTVKELLFAATLTGNRTEKMNIYNAVIRLHNDWKAYNNIACIFLQEGNLTEATTWLDKASQIVSEQADILTNYGIIAARTGNLGKAQKLFDQANTTEKNQAILDIRQGKYAQADRYFKNTNTYNATLAKVLNGNYTSKCNENTADCFYLNAIIGARSGNMQMLTENLAKAIALDSNYKSEASNDMEFANFKTNQEFISLIQ